MEEIIAILKSRSNWDFYPQFNSYGFSTGEAIITIRCNQKDMIYHSPMVFEMYSLDELTCIDGHIYHNEVCIV
jgi:hypothetical protein